MSRRTPALLVALLILPASTSCVKRDLMDDEFRERRPSSVVIQVSNESTSQATVYLAENGGLRARLGDVPSRTQRFFERELIPGRRVIFEIRLLAGPTFRTEGITAIPGDTIEVRIPPHL